MALLCLAVALPASNAIAQEKQHVSIKILAENSKYTQQLNVDVGDRPNHILRVYEVHVTFPNNAPVINGLKLVESWTRGVGDRIEGSGDGRGYEVSVFENGDRYFTQYTNVVQSVEGGNTSSTSVAHITGGTGKFATIQGIEQSTTNFNLKTGFYESKADVEYWFSK
jgi:pyruvate/2-oxoacid:ferredoxin oxidoreductase beta subunit